jgi:hypothetical protein
MARRGAKGNRRHRFSQENYLRIRGTYPKNYR